MEEKFTIQEFKNYLLSQDSLGDIHFFLTAENIRKANQIESKRNYHEKVLPMSLDYDVFTIEEWHEALLSGDYTIENGSGYWVNGDRISDDDVFTTEQLDATHVAWYNN